MRSLYGSGHNCSLVYPGYLHASVAFALSSIGAPRFLPLVARFHDDLFYLEWP